MNGMDSMFFLLNSSVLMPKHFPCSQYWQFVASHPVHILLLIPSFFLILLSARLLYMILHFTHLFLSLAVLVASNFFDDFGNFASCCVDRRLLFFVGVFVVVLFLHNVDHSGLGKKDCPSIMAMCLMTLGVE